MCKAYSKGITSCHFKMMEKHYLIFGTTQLHIYHSHWQVKHFNYALSISTSTTIITLLFIILNSILNLRCEEVFNFNTSITCAMVLLSTYKMFITLDIIKEIIFMCRDLIMFKRITPWIKLLSQSHPRH